MTLVFLRDEVVAYCFSVTSFGISRLDLERPRGGCAAKTFRMYTVPVLYSLYQRNSFILFFSLPIPFSLRIIITNSCSLHLLQRLDH